MIAVVLITYPVFALLVASGAAAMMSFAPRRRFEKPIAIAAGLLWPITIPGAFVGMMVAMAWGAFRELDGDRP